MSHTWLSPLHALTRVYYPDTQEELLTFHVSAADDPDVYPETVARCYDLVHCRLFAAAPDLYRALENLIPLVGPEHAEAVEEARRALEKALVRTGGKY